MYNLPCVSQPRFYPQPSMSMGHLSRRVQERAALVALSKAQRNSIPIPQHLPLPFLLSDDGAMLLHPSVGRRAANYPPPLVQHLPVHPIVPLNSLPPQRAQHAPPNLFTFFDNSALCVCTDRPPDAVFTLVRGANFPPDTTQTTVQQHRTPPAPPVDLSPSRVNVHNSGLPAHSRYSSHNHGNNNDSNPRFQCRDGKMAQKSINKDTGSLPVPLICTFCNTVCPHYALTDPPELLACALCGWLCIRAAAEEDASRIDACSVTAEQERPLNIDTGYVSQPKCELRSCNTWQDMHLCETLPSMVDLHSMCCVSTSHT